MRAFIHGTAKTGKTALAGTPAEIEILERLSMETITIEVVPDNALGAGDIIVKVKGAIPGLIEHALSLAAHELTRQGYGDAELVSGYERPDDDLFILVYDQSTK
jgi:hypothetical protein